MKYFGKFGQSGRKAPREILDFGTVKPVEKHEIFGKLGQSRREAPRKKSTLEQWKLLKSNKYLGSWNNRGAKRRGKFLTLIQENCLKQ